MRRMIHTSALIAFAAIISAIVLAASPSAAPSADAAPASGPHAAKAGKTKVTVPKRYVYDPSRSPKSLHDYCTHAPNKWFKADFRGPCARHDLCYQDVGKNRVTKAACDAVLGVNLRTNCAYAYGGWVKRKTCNGVANTYFAVVIADTIIRG